MMYGNHKANKYRAKRVRRDDGTWYDSQAEANRGRTLRLLERAGHITQLREQHKFKLNTHRDGREVPILTAHGRHAEYRCDFTYFDQDGTFVMEDVKGCDTHLSRLKRAIVTAQTGHTIRLVHASGREKDK